MICSLMWENKPRIDKETNTQIGEYTRIWLAVDRNSNSLLCWRRNKGRCKRNMKEIRLCLHSVNYMYRYENYSYNTVIPKHKTHTYNIKE